MIWDKLEYIEKFNAALDIICTSIFLECIRYFSKTIIFHKYMVFWVENSWIYVILLSTFVILFLRAMWAGLLFCFHLCVFTALQFQFRASKCFTAKVVAVVAMNIFFLIFTVHRVCSPKLCGQSRTISCRKTTTQRLWLGEGILNFINWSPWIL